MTDLLKDSAHWRARAEEAHRVADALADPKARRMMLEIAEIYQRLAELALIRSAKHS